MAFSIKYYSYLRLVIIGLAFIFCITSARHLWDRQKEIAIPGSADAALNLALVFVAKSWQTTGVKSYSLPDIVDGKANVKVVFDKVSCDIDLIQDEKQIEFGWLIKNANCKEK